MRLLALVLFACACGGGSKPATTPPPAPGKGSAAVASPHGASHAALTAETVCARFVSLKQQHCGNFDNIKLSAAECPDVFRVALARGAQKDDKVLAAMGRCMVDQADCDGVMACFATVSYEDPNDLRACTAPNDSRAAGLPAADFARRNGAGVARYRDAKSSKAQPIEMCGISGGIAWLTGLACDDGSHPVASRDDAEQVRAGNVGAGGRCGSIIDLYKVSCPERTYEVYVDGYICPLPQ
jgi:hypothetical protein